MCLTLSGFWVDDERMYHTPGELSHSLIFRRLIAEVNPGRARIAEVIGLEADTYDELLGRPCLAWEWNVGEEEPLLSIEQYSACPVSGGEVDGLGRIVASADVYNPEDIGRRILRKLAREVMPNLDIVQYVENIYDTHTKNSAPYTKLPPEFWSCLDCASDTRKRDDIFRLGTNWTSVWVAAMRGGHECTERWQPAKVKEYCRQIA